jgi:hypothetical protein
MAILNFVKPDKVVMISSTETTGQFEFQTTGAGFWNYNRSTPFAAFCCLLWKVLQ